MNSSDDNDFVSHRVEDANKELRIHETEEYKKNQRYHLEDGVDHYAGDFHAAEGLTWASSYVQPHHWVLNIGCQTGAEQLKLRQMGIRNVVGLDLYPEVAFPKGVVVLKHDMHILPFNNRAFDFVYSRDTLEHSPYPKEVLLEVKRVLKRNGKAFFSVPVDHEAHYHYTVFSVESWRGLFSSVFSYIHELYTETQYIAVMSNKGFMPHHILCE